MAASVAQRVETLLAQAREATERQAREVERQATELHAAKAKIQALTLELAHLRRICGGPAATIAATRGSGWYSCVSTVMPRVPTTFSGSSVSPFMMVYWGGQYEPAMANLSS